MRWSILAPMRAVPLLTFLLSVSSLASVVVGCTGDDAKNTGAAASAGASGASGSAGSAAQGGASGGGGTAGQAFTFSCDASKTPDELPLRRLSKIQYTNSLHDLIDAAMPGLGDTAMASLQVSLAKVPEDVRKEQLSDTRGGFRRLDQVVHQEHIDGTFDVAQSAAIFLTQPQRIATLVGSCATDVDTSNDAACLDSFFTRFGERAWRRPIDEDDLAFFHEVYDATGIDVEALSDVITVMLTAPDFLYFVEHGDSVVSEQTYTLSAFELASRLSFHFWQTSPDATLIDAAKSGALLSDDGYSAQVDRLARDPRARSALDSFFGEWLWLDDVPKMDSLVGTPVYDAFAGDFTPSADLRTSIVNEILDLSAFIALESDGTFDDFFTSRDSFAKTPELAGLYKTTPWDGVSEPPTFSEPERVGLITRAAFVASGSANTRPVIKGVFLRKAMLCDVIPPPPANAAVVPPELSPEMTTREVVEGLTQQPGTDCAGCHEKLINPLGFATENFDALARVRTEQTLFDAQGNVTTKKPIDTTSNPQVPTGTDESSSGAKDLQRIMIESSRPQACFARKYFRFTFGRLDNVSRDGCTLEELRKAIFDEKRPLHEVLARVAKTDAFRRRSFQ